MGKLIAAINMTLDGVGDHTVILPDEEIHQHYTELLRDMDVALYGRTTYQLMQFWQTLLKNPSGERSLDDFAVAMDRIPKIVFSHTLKDVGWESARLANSTLEEEVLALKQQPGKEILVGSRSLIMQLMKLDLLDEFQLCVHPVVAGGGMPLFENMDDRTVFELTKTKTFGGGAIILYYKPTNGGV